MRSLLAFLLLLLALLSPACGDSAAEGEESGTPAGATPASGEATHEASSGSGDTGSGGEEDGGTPAEAGTSTAGLDALDFTPGGPIGDEELGNYLVEMSCSIDGADAGTMVFEFWPEKAPATVRNFFRYASEGLYDGRTYHRIIKGFMIQGGCPNGTGSGKGKYGNIPGEMSSDPRYHHFPGVLSMARGRSVDSGSCQFFVCNARATSLDGSYASFGKLISGMETLTAISNVPCISNGRDSRPSQPTKKVVMESVRVVRKEQG